MVSSSYVILSLVASAAGHFVLQLPTSLGFDDEKESAGPCGNKDPTDRSTGVTDWAVGGDNIGLLSTHPVVSWEINVALTSDTSKFVPLIQLVKQSSGVGNVCFKGIPGIAAWEGKDVVLQVVQTAPDGKLYQCAAIRFVAGGPHSAPSSCSNSNGVSVGSIVPASPPSGGSSSATSGRPLPASSSSNLPAGSAPVSPGAASPSNESSAADHPTESSSASGGGGAPAASASPSRNGAGGSSGPTATKTASHTVVTAGAQTSKLLCSTMLAVSTVFIGTSVFLYWLGI